MSGLVYSSGTINPLRTRLDYSYETSSSSPTSDTEPNYNQTGQAHLPSLSIASNPADEESDSSDEETTTVKYSPVYDGQGQQSKTWERVIERFNERVAFDGKTFMGIHLEQKERFEDLVFIIAAATHSITNQIPDHLDEPLRSLTFNIRDVTVDFPGIYPLPKRFQPLRTSKGSKQRIRRWQKTIAYLQATLSECTLPNTLVHTLSSIAKDIQAHRFSRYFLAKTVWSPEEEDQGIDSLLRWWAATDHHHRWLFCQEFHSADTGRKRLALYELNHAMVYVSPGGEAKLVSQGLDDIARFRRRIMAALTATFEQLVDGARRLGVKAEIDFGEVEQ